MRISTTVLALLLSSASSAFALCSLISAVEPVKETLPPESEVVRAPNQRPQLHYRGATPIVFFSKTAMPLDVSGSVQLAAMGLPTRRGETPIAKIEGDRQFRFARGQLDENGRLQIKGWELESTPSAYPLAAPVPPTRDETAQIAYYYGRELRKIDVKYTFKRVCTP